MFNFPVDNFSSHEAEDLSMRERLAKYIPPKEEWTPVDEALYGIEDIYNVPDDKAKELREDAIRYSFRHHSF